MPSNDQKRTYVKEAYPWPSWEAKVDKMSDAKVHTIYMRIINNKK